mgnify:CR=1 FL=1
MSRGLGDVYKRQDEYIKMIDDRNASLEDQMTQAQEAMCEIYEMMA